MRIKDDFCNLIVESIEDLKAVKPTVIDIYDVSFMADYLIVCTGTSSAHVQGIANSVIKKAKDNGHAIYSTEGLNSGEWVLIDLGTVLVNVMQDSVRSFYKLEQLWSNGKVVHLDESKSLNSK